LYKVCESYVDWFRGDEDGDPSTNGEYNLIRRWPLGEGVVFDVGANQGDWAAEVLQRHPNVEVHCFEPGDTAFSRLRARQLDRCRLNRLAVGDQIGQVTLRRNGLDDVSSLYAVEDIGAHFPGHDGSAAAQVVAITTVDEYCAARGIDRIRLLKIDTEGHEMAVLKGAERMLSTGRVDALQIEYTYWWISARHYLGDLFRFLGERGYRMFKILPNGLMPLESYRHRLETFRYCNLFATAQPVGSDLVIRSGPSNLSHI
jgi:FkbM family methyltransferase